jgi:phosphomannomutase
VSDLSRIFKAYDVRGVYPDEIDEDAARRIGAAFAVFTDASCVLVGRDMRTSSEPLASAFIEGVTDAGADAVDLGCVSTDLTYFASGVRELPAAMFTASHNPGQYNGIKFSRAGAAPVGQETGLVEILRLASSELPTASRAGEVHREDMLTAFAEHLLGLVDAEAIRGLTVVVDAGNGMAGKVVPAVFDHLDVRLVPLYFELDGTFPNHPADPIQPENLADLREAVLAEGADVGLAFDGDADRVFLTDEAAEPVSGSLTTALVAERVLAKHPGATVIYNVICSRVVREVIESSGGKGVPSRVGHSFIKQLMASTGAVFAGEHSGHYYFRENFRADSGLLAALFVLETMATEGEPLSRLLAPLRRYAASGEINIEVEDQQEVIERVAGAYSGGEVDRTDGLTVSYPDWWFNVRPSNTEPLLRLNVEAADQEMMERKVIELRSSIEG